MLTEDRKASLIAKKIKTEFPDTAEGRLWWAVVNQALIDITATPAQEEQPPAGGRRDRWTEAKRRKNSAIEFLQGDMLQVEVCGVDPDWIKRVIKKIGLDMESDWVDTQKDWGHTAKVMRNMVKKAGGETHVYRRWNVSTHEWLAFGLRNESFHIKEPKKGDPIKIGTFGSFEIGDYMQNEIHEALSEDGI